MKIVMFTNAAGGVEFAVPGAGVGIEAVLARSIPAGATNVEVIEDTDVPADRTYRDAWRQSGVAVAVDMPLARGVHARRIAEAQGADITGLRLIERQERLLGNTAKADKHAVDLAAAEALDTTATAGQIAGAATTSALKQAWPAKITKQRRLR